MNATLSRNAFTAFNILAQKPVTRAEERRTEFDRPLSLMTPRKRGSPSLTRLCGVHTMVPSGEPSAGRSGVVSGVRRLSGVCPPDGESRTQRRTEGVTTEAMRWSPHFENLKGVEVRVRLLTHGFDFKLLINPRNYTIPPICFIFLYICTANR